MPSEKSTLTFKALFLLEDFRELLRKTAPQHKFNDNQREEALKILNDIEKIIKTLKEKL